VRSHTKVNKIKIHVISQVFNTPVRLFTCFKSHILASGDDPEGMKPIGLVGDIIKRLLLLRVIFMEILMSQQKWLEYIKIVTTFVRSVPVYQISGLRTKTLGCQSYNFPAFSSAHLVSEFCSSHI
jgi:hypothetical protein